METHYYILVADSGSARLFGSDEKIDGLAKLWERSNPEGRMMRGELDTDRPGVQRSDSGGMHGLGGDRDSHRHQSEVFARDLCELLHKAHAANAFRKLILIAPPQFLGALRQHLSKDCARVLEKSIDKDLVRADERSIIGHLQ